MKIETREAKKGDVPILMELWECFMKEHDGIIGKKQAKFETRKKGAFAGMKKMIEKEIRSKKKVVFLAEVSGEIVGYTGCLIILEASIYPNKYFGQPLDIYVKPAFRREGVADALFGEVMRWLKRKKISKVFLKVNINNKISYKFCKKRGFEDSYIEMVRKI